MIKKDEILEMAFKLGLTADIIEKDYVLSWVLAGIMNQSLLAEAWVFKGGTCLKKCYFEEYRFSEDLDFTLKDDVQMDTDFLYSNFEKVVEWVYDLSGIDMPRVFFKEYKNPRGNKSMEGKLEYRGPLARKGDNPRIKLDLTADELLVFEPVEKTVYHPYADNNDSDFKIFAYGIEEIFAEKMRAMVQRLRPRDLYDVVNLYRNHRWVPDKQKILYALEKKSKFKNVNLPSMALLNSMRQKNDLISDWEQMLGHQVAGLEGYETYWSALPSLFEWLYS